MFLTSIWTLWGHQVPAYCLLFPLFCCSWVDPAVPTFATSPPSPVAWASWSSAHGQISVQAAAFVLCRRHGSLKTSSALLAVLLSSWLLEFKYLSLKCAVFQSLQKLGQTDAQFGPQFDSEMILEVEAINPWAGWRESLSGKRLSLNPAFPRW